MPAKRLDEQIVSIRRYDVAGQDSDATPHFIRHVGLIEQDQDDVCCDSEVPLTHMGPPLQTARNKKHAIQTTGSAQLNSDEREKVRVFVDELSSEYAAHNALGGARQYIIVPHYKEPDADCSYHRFSCAGFVIESYRAAEIRLLPEDTHTLPFVTFETLIQAYSDWENELQNAKLRKRLGLDGDGPWPALLAGYVLNSLDRDVISIRDSAYSPVLGDEYFPSRRTS